jgi:Ser-tRNA(Ala) deacylase AlaX
METLQTGSNRPPMRTPPTRRLYPQDSHSFESDARIVGVREESVAFDQSCFYTGGGGQPADEGSVRLGSGELLEIVSVQADPDDVLWHISASRPLPAFLEQPARLIVNRERRLSLMRYHTVLHVLNTIALREYGGWITGVRIAADYSRIDFKLEGFSGALCAELERKVNAVLEGDHAVTSYYLPEAEFRRRDDLLRTLEAKPPVSQGQVRVVEIQGFDAQACGGTHVNATPEVGRFTIFRTENKGKLNKRLYVRLDPAEPRVISPA